MEIALNQKNMTTIFGFLTAVLLFTSFIHAKEGPNSGGGGFVVTVLLSSSQSG